MKKLITKFKFELFVIIIGAVLFIPYLGSIHLFDWDEINFAEASREMITTGDYLTVRIGYEPFHEKPPLFLWSQVISMKIFGINEFAARLPNAIVGICTLLFVFVTGKKLFDVRFGLIWVLAYIGSFLPHLYFRTGIIDPLFNLLIYLGLYFIYKYFDSFISDNQEVNRNKMLFLSGLFTGLSVLTKGPVGYLLTILTILAFLYISRKIIKFPYKPLLVHLLLSFIPIIFWYVIVILSSDSKTILVDFIGYQIRLLTSQDAGHGGPIYYHLIVLLIGCFPSSIFLFGSFKNDNSDTLVQKQFKLWNIILLTVVVIIFSLVETKIVHYSSLAYFPLTLLATYNIYKILYFKKSLHKGYFFSISIIWSLFGIASLTFVFLMQNIQKYLQYIKDDMTRYVLQAKITWGFVDFLPGTMLLLLLIPFIVFFIRKKYLESILMIFATTSITMILLIFLLTPKIEAYTQKSTIDYFSRFKNIDCYVQPIGYKSYAHYFYAKVPKESSRYYNNNIPEDKEKWLLTGDIDKTVFFSSKKTSWMEISKKYKNLIYLYERNGFVFYKRDPEIFRGVLLR